MSRMTETDQRLVSAALDAREHPEPVPGYLLGGPCRWCGHDQHPDGPCSASINARTSSAVNTYTFEWKSRRRACGVMHSIRQPFAVTALLNT